MNADRLDNSIREFYAEQSASDDAVARLSNMVPADQAVQVTPLREHAPVADAAAVGSADADSAKSFPRALQVADITPVARKSVHRPWLVGSGRFFIGIAAMALLAFSAYRIGHQRGIEKGRVDGIEYARANQPSQPTPAAPVSEPTNYPRYLELPREAPTIAATRLVVLRQHADWCPRCPTIAPIFEELAEKFHEEPILFVTLNITTPETRTAARELIRSLGVQDYVGKKLEPGVIRLVDRDAKSVVAEVRAYNELPAMKDALVHALPHKTEPTP